MLSPLRTHERLQLLFGLQCLEERCHHTGYLTFFRGLCPTSFPGRLCIQNSGSLLDTLSFMIP